MSLFVDRSGRRKSPLALSAFFTGILFFFIYGALYVLLAEPLYHSIAFESVLLTNVVHSVIIALAGSLLCCLMFLLPDKQIAPLGFLCVAILTLVLYAASAAMAEGRAVMMQFVSMYCLAPTIIGNLIGWSVYALLCRQGYKPAARKTIAEELNEAIQKEKKAAKNAAAQAPAKPAEAPSAPQQEAPAPVEAAAPAEEEESQFGPDTDLTAPPMAGYSYQEEAMLLFGEADELKDLMDEHLDGD